MQLSQERINAVTSQLAPYGALLDVGGVNVVMKRTAPASADYISARLHDVARVLENEKFIPAGTTDFSFNSIPL